MDRWGRGMQLGFVSHSNNNNNKKKYLFWYVWVNLVDSWRHFCHMQMDIFNWFLCIKRQLAGDQFEQSDTCKKKSKTKNKNKTMRCTVLTNKPQDCIMLVQSGSTNPRNKDQFCNPQFCSSFQSVQVICTPECLQTL